MLLLLREADVLLLLLREADILLLLGKADSLLVLRLRPGWLGHHCWLARRHDFACGGGRWRQSMISCCASIALLQLVEVGAQAKHSADSQRRLRSEGPLTCWQQAGVPAQTQALATAGRGRVSGQSERHSNAWQHAIQHW